MKKEIRNKEFNSQIEYPGFADIFYQSPVAIELYDAKGMLFGINPACMKLFGLKNVGAVLGFNLFSDPNLPQTTKNQLIAGKDVTYDLVFDFDVVANNKLYETTRTGLCYLECTIRPTFSTSHSILGYIAYVNEVTGLKLANQKMEKQATELINLNITKDKFFSIIAHDLKSPFNSILGFSDLMLQNYQDLDDKTFIKGLETIRSASEQAYKLLENLLLWAKNQFRGLDFKPEWVNLNDQIQESIDFAAAVIQKKELLLTFEQECDVQVLLDKNMIDLVLRNLVSNAIKFSYPKGKIIIKLSKNEHDIQISVTDFGVGIPESDLENLFNIHHSKPSVGTQNEQGTGLGLILCKDFIENHNGKLRVESKVGKGSKFTVIIPVNNT